MTKVDDNDENNKAPDPKDASRWRLNNVLTEGAAVTKKLVRVPVRKPNKNEFFRVHPDEDYRLNVALIEGEEGNDEMYLVAPEITEELMDVAKAYTLYVCINRQGVVFLSPVKLPDADGKLNSWPKSAHENADDATRAWISQRSNRSLGAYEPYFADASIPDPVWPPETLMQLLEVAFKGLMVETADHTLVMKLRGQI